jgi:hypothetical protein
MADFHELRFEGGLLRRGFWLYVWEVTPPAADPVYYVGRTGDSSSLNAQSPFNRMGQHLGFAPNSSMLRRHVVAHGLDPELCHFRLVAVDPLEAESTAVERAEHDARRDIVAAMEKALAEGLRTAGCLVMNTVHSRKVLDEARFAEIRAAFEAAIPALSRPKNEAEGGAS